MPLAHIQFQKAAVECLRQSIHESRLAHAWLFFGPEGVGKSLAALAVCEALLCTQQPGEGCGSCSACKRAKQRTHVDLAWLCSERGQVQRGWLDAKALSKQPSAEIHVEQIRRLQERLHVRALEGKHKIAVIVDAHELNMQAQNALLKTLEEPPANTLLLLCTHQKELLLPTLKSRCQPLAFRPLPLAFIVEQLVAWGVGEPWQAARLAEQAEGSLGRAQRLGQGWLEFQQKTEAEFFALEAKTLSGLLAFAERHGANRGVAEQCLDALLVVLAGKAKESAKREGGGGQEAWRWLYAYEQIEQAKVAIVRRNGAPRLQLEAMLLNIFSERVPL
ncbi:MAG: DNA polymerase III subunit delta' [Cystobacterineae bacterium]|nr:DNA polymerase III subunit delta' [Cystobacterineae bacterium]